MPLGRLDSTSARLWEANLLPTPFDSLDQLEEKFHYYGLDYIDLTVLSGAHSVGSSICSAFRGRVWGGDSNIDPSFALQARQNCPASGGDTQLTPLTTPNTNRLSNQYYKNLIAGKGLLHTDQQLFNGSSMFTDPLVKKYSTNQAAFFRDFSVSMVKLGNVGILEQGEFVQAEVRLNCRKVN